MNDTLTEKELQKIFLMYKDYGPERLGDFLRMIWAEAYDLGYNDAQPKRC